MFKLPGGKFENEGLDVVVERVVEVVERVVVVVERVVVVVVDAVGGQM